ncbi:MAG: diguanylate cyclase [Firmicutes bacterium]|nr:diguanylate cyclase [Bacillota bacterium]
MRICITSQGDTIEAAADGSFGRAAYFIIWENDEVEILPNPGFKSDHGAGVVASQAVIAANADVLITGHLGPNAAKALKPSGVKVYRLEVPAPTVKVVYQAYLAGELEPLIC